MKSLPILKRSHAQAGFSVVEVIVATLIFGIAATGIFAMTAGLQKPAAETTEDVNAALVGKRVLENLRTAVDRTTWFEPGGPLDTAGTHTLSAVTVDGVAYTPAYTVTEEADGGRKVMLDITW